MYAVKSEPEETEAATDLRKEAGCFVLVCNVPSAGTDKYNSYDVLRAYKDQYGIEESWKKRRTDKPTSFMVMSSFQYQLVLKIGKLRKLARPLTNNQQEYLMALGLSSKIFTVPGG